MKLKLKDSSLLRTQAYINGHWKDAENGECLDVINPATGEIFASVASVGEVETQLAIDAAKLALPGWRQKTAKERSQIMRAWFNLIIENQEDLAIIMTTEQGKPLAESRAEIIYAASFIEWFAEEAKRVYGDITPTTSNDRRLLTIKQPVGVVAAITPWNFPSAMLTRKAGPALAVGCTFIIKPASETPLSAMALVELAERAGIPAGVINLVTGKNSPSIGDTLVRSDVVRKLSFTGSTPVGKQLLRGCADTVKKVSMELGGNAPIIVFDDADLDKAVAGALASKYRNAGQTCICANRILVQASIYDLFAEKFSQAVDNLQVGDGMDIETTMGPLLNTKAVTGVDGLVQDALNKGATALIGGGVSKQGECFYQPTVLTNVSEDMRVHSEEIFGPVAPLFRFDDEEQAISMANDTEFGLASYVYTKNLGRIWRVCEALEYGMVGVNEVAITSEVIPFGGVKESGMGREGSRLGVEDYLETKYICMGDLL